MSRPARLQTFDYLGIQRYFLTTCTYQRHPLFEDHAVVELVAAQILRTASEEAVAVDAYCFMPDHLHAVVTGEMPNADFTRFVRLAKQRSGVRVQRATGQRLWQEGYHERVLRDEESTPAVIAYVVNNPVRGGLVHAPSDYPFWGSSRHTREQILEFIQAESGRRPWL